MDDFKELIYFFISLIMVTFVITFGINVMGLAKQIGGIRNEEIITAEVVSIVRKYDAFDNKTVLGCDVIAALRENTQNGELTITVNSPVINMNAGNYKNTSFKLSALSLTIDASARYIAVLVNENEIRFTKI